MKKNVGVLVLVILVLGAIGCSQRLIDFTIISSKNIDLTQAATFQRSQSRVNGEDARHIIIFIPTGVPNAKEALDRAIESVPGAIALVDGVITHHWWYIPYIFGRSWYVVEGTPLINPKIASTKPIGNYMVSKLDKNGHVEEFKILDKSNYEQLRNKVINGAQ
ncbi:MAG: hypothetical protein SVW57_00985 [Thermodesulfobacteriota bacterium]|nr:hypothetical protein [Thermodesulfobacteriota bacterium]